MPLSNRMVQRRLAGRVGRVDGAAVLDEEVEHGHRADGGGAVERVLAALVAHACRGRLRAAALEQLAGEVEVGFGGDEVEGCLFVGGRRGLVLVTRGGCWGRIGWEEEGGLLVLKEWVCVGREECVLGRCYLVIIISE